MSLVKKFVEDAQRQDSTQVRVQKYSDDQPRDEHGRWSPGGAHAEHGNFQESHHSASRSGKESTTEYKAGDAKVRVQEHRLYAGQPADKQTYSVEERHPSGGYRTIHYSDSKAGALGALKERYGIDHKHFS